MSREKCFIDVYQRQCADSKYRTLPEKSLMITPPCCCRSTEYYRLFREKYGITYLQIGGVDSGKMALDAGWQTYELVLWVNDGNKTYDDIRYIVNTICQYAVRATSDAMKEVDDRKIAQLRPFHAIAFEEPWRDTGFWADITSCIYFESSNDICECVRKIIGDFAKDLDGKTFMTLIRMAYLAKYALTAQLTDSSGTQVQVPMQTRTVAYDYDNEWMFFGRDAYDAAKKLNECYHLIDEVADDHYDPDEFKHAVESGICNQVFINTDENSNNVHDAINAATNLHIPQVNIIGLDEYYCTRPCTFDAVRCDLFLKNLDSMFLYLQRYGYVENVRHCWDQLMGTKVCIHEDCDLCRPEVESDWIMQWLD